MHASAKFKDYAYLRNACFDNYSEVSINFNCRINTLFKHCSIPKIFLNTLHIIIGSLFIALIVFIEWPFASIIE